MGFVDLDFECSTVCPTAWADGNLAEAARLLGKLVEHRNPGQPNPGLRQGTPYTEIQEGRDSRNL